MDRSLVRHAWGAPRWLLLAVGSVAAGATAACLIWQFAHISLSACEREVQHGDRRRGAAICLASYEQTGHQRDLALAAKAYMYAGELDQAEKLAYKLVAGPFFGDAHAILSYVALRRGSGRAARMHSTLAVAGHLLAGDERGLTSDCVSLSQLAWQAGDFTAALEAADEALRHARRLHDPHYEVASYLARIDALRRMGDTQAAIATATSALERATDPCDKTWASLKKAMCEVEAGQMGLAMIEFAMTAQANRSCGNRDVATSAAISQAWLLRWKDPSGALASLDELAKSVKDDVETFVLRGYLAADRGALAEADRYLTLAAGLEPPHADWPWQIACARAELFDQPGLQQDDTLAEHHYRSSVAMVASLRATARARSAYLVSSHRGAYDGLIALHARQGRWRDALAVVLDLDASDMLRATSVETATHVRVSLDVETGTPRSVSAPSTNVEAVLSAWQSRDLVIVVAQSLRQVGRGRERVYRITITDGQITGEDVGDASAARKWAADLYADPDDRSAARALGRMIVPRSPSDRTLHVLAIGSLGKVPLAALRDDDGSLIIRRRPLVRVLGLQVTGPEARGIGAPVVLADPRGDLPSAAIEGRVVAEALGPGTQVSGSGTSSRATRSRLWAASDAALLHIAGHVGVVGRWRALQLADGDADPAEIVERRLAPRIAVLASCGSAAATDEEGWGSIASALLESGTAVVIATDRSIDDKISLKLMTDFYAQFDWHTDPARALARVQQALDARAGTSEDGVTKARSWAAFSVLSRPPEIR